MDYELIFWVVCGIASAIALVVLRVAGEKDSSYIEWIRDQNERRY